MTPFEAGFLAMRHAVFTGAHVPEKLADIATNDGLASDVCVGAACGVLSVFVELISQGFLIESADAQVDSFFKADKFTQEIIIRRSLKNMDVKPVFAMAGLIGGCQKILRFVEVKTPTAPVPVRVVAMPERERVTEVTRDAQGNITAARQVERDAGGVASLQHQAA
jgi:hypothetical protein